MGYIKVLVVVLIVTLCTVVMPGVAQKGFSSIFQALTNPMRPKLDTDLDALRKPEQVLRFFNIQPGMKVLDVFAGAGYYTEILSHLVGEQGEVAMHNHSLWHLFFEKQSDARIAGNRLKNVNRIIQDINNTELKTEYYDVAVIILGLHDLYLSTEKSETGQALDAEGFLQAVFQSVKPGGTVGVVEHNAKVGTPPEQSASLHRLEEGYIIKLMQRAGFVLEARSDMLRNANDNYNISVFTPSIRRKTDRSVLRFRRPESAISE